MNGSFTVRINLLLLSQNLFSETLISKLHLIPISVKYYSFASLNWLLTLTEASFCGLIKILPQSEA